MSGHSKWSQIRRQKEANDLKKGQVYTRIAKQIVLAAKQGGGDPEINFSLRMALNRAKSVNMPSDSIDKAVKKGLGEDKNAAQIENITYEAYGYSGATMLVDVLTDNRNRSAADVRLVIEKNGGRMVEAGALSWQYEPQGLITMLTENAEEKNIRLNRKWNDKIELRKLPSEKNSLEEFEMNILDVEGIMDFSTEEDEGIYIISIVTKPDMLDLVRRKIDEFGYDIEQGEIIKKATMEVELSEEDLDKNRKLIEKIEENEDVDNIWTNIKGL